MRIISFLYFSLLVMISNAQVKIGDNLNTIDPSALLELESTEKALLLPRVSTLSTITNPATGLLVYQTSDHRLYVFTGDAWSPVSEKNIYTDDGVLSGDREIDGGNFNFNMAMLKDYNVSGEDQFGNNYNLGLLNINNTQFPVKGTGIVVDRTIVENQDLPVKQILFLGDASEVGDIGWEASNVFVLAYDFGEHGPNGFANLILESDGVNGRFNLSVSKDNDSNSSVFGREDTLYLRSFKGGENKFAEIVLSNGNIGLYSDSIFFNQHTTTNQVLYLNGQGHLRAGSIDTNEMTDNLGNHNLTQNLQTNLFWISHDGSSNGIHIQDNNRIGLGGVNHGDAILEVFTGAQFTSAGSDTIYENKAANPAGDLTTLSIGAESNILANAFVARSDARLKNFEGLTDFQSDLELLKSIEIANYRMKDHIQFGGGTHKKVIAQQVEVHFPQAVSKTRGFIPDIYKMCTILPWESDQYILPLILPQTRKGDIIKMINGNKSYNGEVTGIMENGFISVSGLPKEISDIFVYGHLVDDLRVVDYEALSMLHMSATQALIGKVEHLEKQQEELTKNLARIEKVLSVTTGETITVSD